MCSFYFVSVVPPRLASLICKPVKSPTLGRWHHVLIRVLARTSEVTENNRYLRTCGRNYLKQKGKKKNYESSNRRIMSWRGSAVVSFAISTYLRGASIPLLFSSRHLVHHTVNILHEYRITDHKHQLTKQQHPTFTIAFTNTRSCVFTMTHTSRENKLEARRALAKIGICLNKKNAASDES